MRELEHKILRLGFKLVSFALLFLILVTAVKPVSIMAADTNAGANGVAGFSGCDFSSIQKNPKTGSTLFQTCINQVLTFIFVMGLFLIVFRVGLSAFENINPGSDGNAIKNSVSAISDIVIGLLLIVGPGIVLATINPATLSLNFLDLGKLASGGSSKSTSSSTPTNSSTPTTSSSSTTSSTPASSSTPATSSGSNGTNNNVLPANVSSPADLSNTLTYYKANPNNTTAKSTLRNYLVKEQDCGQIFIDASKVSECRDITQNYGSILNDVASAIGSLPPKETPSSYTGAIAVTTELKTVSSMKYGNDQIIIARYVPSLDSFGGTGNSKQEITLQISGCTVDNSITTPNNALVYYSNITGSGCSMKILSNNTIQ